MTTTLDRPSVRTEVPSPPRDRQPRSGPPKPDSAALVELAVVALMVTAVVPLNRVFATTDWVRPIGGVMLVTLGVAAVARRARMGLLLTLLMEVLAAVLYLGVVFVPATLVGGIVPTLDTLTALWTLLTQGLALLPERTAPTAVVPPFALLAVAGTGAIAAIADLLVHAGRAPLKAAVVALTLWAVPLAMAPDTASVWPHTVPILAAIAFLLLTTSSADLARWGRWIYPRGRGDRNARGTVGAGGLITSISAIAAGMLFAGSLPGYGERPWWELRGEGGSTLTANPIVQLRSNLVASGTEPIFTVQTPRPVYLRTTALDRYGEFEEWTTSGIRTRPLRNGLMATGTVDDAFDVQVTVGDIGRADLVPMPYQPLRVEGGISPAFQFDPRTGTVALDEGVELQPDHSYAVETAVPRPTAEQLDRAGVMMPDDPLTQLPDNVPAEVATLAREIVDRAEATTVFRQAMAIQNELRTWEYSLEPPPGHDGTAMTRFLENRIGYCEQFAGTMAVMLRTLDIPARVAVGFTPGKLLEPGGDTYAVSWSNSHSWVEVLFDDVGWIAFEPTPRGDGNVLVPTSGDPSPQVLEQEPTTVTGPQGPYDDAGQPILPGDQDFPSADDRRDPGAPLPESGTAASSGSPATALVLLGVMVAIATAAIAWRRTVAAPSPDAPPVERILAAGRRVCRVGAGLHVPPRPSETDGEYLHRLAVGSGAGESARELARMLTRARYARNVDIQDAARAEQAAKQVTQQLVGSLSRFRRVQVSMRGAAVELLTTMRDTAPLRRWSQRQATTMSGR